MRVVVTAEKAVPRSRNSLTDEICSMPSLPDWFLGVVFTLDFSFGTTVIPSQQALYMQEQVHNWGFFRVYTPA